MSKNELYLIVIIICTLLITITLQLSVTDRLLSKARDILEILEEKEETKKNGKK